MQCFKKTLPSDVFDNVLQTAKHRTNDASKDVNHPPLLRHASSACAFLNYLRLFWCWGMIAFLTMACHFSSLFQNVLFQTSALIGWAVAICVHFCDLAPVWIRERVFKSIFWLKYLLHLLFWSEAWLLLRSCWSDLVRQVAGSVRSGKLPDRNMLQFKI